MSDQFRQIDVNGEMIEIPALATKDQEAQFARKHYELRKSQSQPAPELRQSPLALPADQAKPVAPSNMAFVKDNLKRGFFEGAGTLGGAAAFLNPVAAVRNFAQGKDVLTEAKKAFTEVQDAGNFAGEAAGVKNYEPQSTAGRVAGVALRALTDPVTLATMGGGAALSLGRTAALTGTRQAAGVASVVGKEALLSSSAAVGATEAQRGIEAAGGSQTLQMLGGLLGGMGTGLAATSIVRQTRIPTAFEKAMSATDAWAAVNTPGGRKAAAEQAATKANAALAPTVDAAGNARVAQRLDQAAKAYEMETGRSLATSLEDSIATQKGLGVEPTIQGTGSTELRSILNEASADPTVRGQQQSRVDALRQAVANDTKAKFGDVSENLDSVESMTSNPTGLQMSRQAKDAIDTLDGSIEQLTKQSIGEVKPEAELGTKIKGLVAEKERIAKAEFAPLYDDLIKANEDKVISGQYIKDNVLPVLDENISDAMFSASPAAKRLRALLGSATEEVSGSTSPLVDAQGKALGKPSLVGLRVTQLNDLKQTVNKAIAEVGADNWTQREYLQNVKDAILGKRDLEGVRSGGMAQQVSPEFSQGLASVDKAYAEQVGKVFKTDALKNMSRKSFESDIVPFLSQRPEHLSDYLRASGPEGVALAEDAILHPLRVIADKAPLTDANIQAWKTKNKEALSMLPGLDAAIGNLEATRGALKGHKQLVNDRLSEVLREDMARKMTAADGTTVSSKDVLTSTTTNAPIPRFQNPQDMVDRFVKDPTFARKLLTQYGKEDTKDAMTALGAIIVQQSMETAQPLQSLSKIAASNPPVKAMITGYMDNAGKLLAVLDDIKDVKPKGDPAASLPKSDFAKATGVSGGFLFDRLRERLSSAPQKIGSILKEGFSNKGKKAESAELLKLIDNPEKMLATLKALEKIKGGGAGAEEAAAEMGMRMTRLGWSFVKQNAKDSVKGAQYDSARRALVIGTQAEPTVDPAERDLKTRDEIRGIFAAGQN